MSFLVPIVMFGWIPVVLYLFMRIPAQRAVIVSFIVAWLFLPVAEYALPGLPDYTKMSATCYGILLATFIYDVGRFSSFKFSWIDLPMLIWCLCPLASSITNGLGAYDGFSTVLTQTLTWGVPYFLGRIYLNNLSGLRELAIGIFMGGLVYVPLCLFEIRFSPQLHRILYGFHAHPDFGQTMRYGGWRPTVFMIHGLPVGLWMMAASLVGIWLWHTGVIKQLWNIPMKWLVAAVLITFILCKSTGAYFLLLLGVGILFVGKQFRTALPVFILIGVICSYLYINSQTETYVSDQIISHVSNVVPADRIQSLQFRFDNEELLVDKARKRIVFGWGGWGRSLIFNDKGEQVTVPDSLWILAFGETGTVGLASLTTSLLMPVLTMFWFRCPAELWPKRQAAPVAVLTVAVALYMVEFLLNAHGNPVFVLACGGLSGLVIQEPTTNKVKKVPALVAQRSRNQNRNQNRNQRRQVQRN
ncbi:MULTISPECIES: O-antigen ligase domain-containing protein [unclassified Moorena]|uniref:O-antigen ligase domain-containing protein n=1 Tax=unclassified Moorena TaxID=2683338 RepID=UPI001400C4B3|nr:MULTISPECIES: O-antigen ligase domain-containing protein [unclassified Moorena]NEO12547.1 O-antigen ligase domain-containing protein [Moorena sp. SIO3E8]NEP97823.1 O-antigen ligase domain-containing protein [Moorena sp. SIO3F7]